MKASFSQWEPHVPALLREVAGARLARRVASVPPLAAVRAGEAHLGVFDGADVAARHELARLAEAAVLPVLAAHLERDAARLRHAHHLLSLAHAERHRLLAVDVLAGLHRGDRDDRVPVVRRDHHDGVHRRVRHHLAPVRGHAARRVSVVRVDLLLEHLASAGVLAVVAVAARLQDGVAHHGDLHALVAEERGHVRIGLRAAADDAEVDAVGGLRTTRYHAAAGERRAPSAGGRARHARQEPAPANMCCFHAAQYIILKRAQQVAPLPHPALNMV